MNIPEWVSSSSVSLSTSLKDFAVLGEMTGCMNRAVSTAEMRTKFLGVSEVVAVVAEKSIGIWGFITIRKLFNFKKNFKSS